MNRTPPDDVRRLLRKEVGFGCPVEGCDSPYLEWHHFDPPWTERQHHDPAGIVALCVLHHGQADQATWTKDQLRAFKDPNRNRADERIRGRFRWKRERLILLAGSNWYVGCPILMRFRTVPMIWLTRDQEGYELLNLDLFDERGVPRLQLRDNDWIVDRRVEDLECTPKKASLIVRTAELGAELSISFQRADRDVIRANALRIAKAGHEAMEAHMREWIKNIPEEHRQHMTAGMRPNHPAVTAEEMVANVLEGIPLDDSAMCVIEGRLRWPVEVTLGPTRMTLPRQNTFSGGLIKGSGVGIQFE